MLIWKGPSQWRVALYNGNTPAELAYKKAGFEYANEKRHQDFEAFIGCPGIVRLLRDLWAGKVSMDSPQTGNGLTEARQD